MSKSKFVIVFIARRVRLNFPHFQAGFIMKQFRHRCHPHFQSNKSICYNTRSWGLFTHFFETARAARRPWPRVAHTCTQGRSKRFIGARVSSMKLLSIKFWLRITIDKCLINFLNNQIDGKKNRLIQPTIKFKEL